MLVVTTPTNKVSRTSAPITMKIRKYLQRAEGKGQWKGGEGVS